MSALTRRGGPIRILNTVDEFTRLALGFRVDRSIGARAVMADLEELFAKHGKPKIIRCDNGRKFITSTLRDWLARQGVRLVHIETARPQQKACATDYTSFIGSIGNTLCFMRRPAAERFFSRLASDCCRRHSSSACCTISCLGAGRAWPGWGRRTTGKHAAAM